MKTLLRFFVAFILAAHSNLAAQSNEAAPGDNLVVEGIPKIPTALAESASRYTHFRYGYLASWHPTKREMLISTEFEETPQIHALKFPGGARTQLTFYSDYVSGGIYQPKRGSCFIFSKDTNGDEFNQIYRYDMATGEVTLLTDGKSRNESPAWSNSGEWLMYGSTRRNGTDMDLYVINPLEPKSNRMLAQLEGGFWIPYDWSPDDSKALIYQHISATENNLWIIDVKTGEKSLLTPKDGNKQTAYWLGQFSKDGKGVYVTTDRDSEFQRLAYIDLATRQYKHLTDRLQADVDEFDLSLDGKTLAYVSNEEGIGRLHLLDLETCGEKPAPKLPTGNDLTRSPAGSQTVAPAAADSGGPQCPGCSKPRPPRPPGT